MFKVLKEIFSDKNGQLSLMRVMCYTCLLMAIAICIIGLIKDKLPDYNIQIIEWLSYAFMGKWGQKVIEGK